MLSAAFLVLLTIAVMNANRLLVESETETYRGEALELASNYGQALLIEASRKKFDKNALDSVYQNKDVFTSPGSLGPESGETISPWPDIAPFKSPTVYDDLDDYNGYQRIIDTVDTKRIPGFLLKVTVYYVKKSAPGTIQTSQQYLKRLDVTVEHPSYVTKPITFSTIVTY